MEAKNQSTRPRQVEIAVSLMFLNMFVGNLPRTVGVILGVISGRIAPEVIGYKIADEFVIWGFSLGLLG